MRISRYQFRKQLSVSSHRTRKNNGLQLRKVFACSANTATIGEFPDSGYDYRGRLVPAAAVRAHFVACGRAVCTFSGCSHVCRPQCVVVHLQSSGKRYAICSEFGLHASQRFADLAESDVLEFAEHTEFYCAELQQLEVELAVLEDQLHCRCSSAEYTVGCRDKYAIRAGFQGGGRLMNQRVANSDLMVPGMVESPPPDCIACR